MPSSTWNWPWLMIDGVDRHAGRVHRRAIAVETGAAAQDVRRPADDADPAMAEVEQVARRRQPAVPVRRADRRRVVERLTGRVDDDERDPTGLQLASRIDSLRSEKTAMTPVGRRANALSIQPRPGRASPLHLGQDDRQVMPAGHPLDATDDLEGPLAVELVEDQLDDRRRRAVVDPDAGTRARGSPPRRGGASRARRPPDR